MTVQTVWIDLTGSKQWKKKPYFSNKEKKFANSTLIKPSASVRSAWRVSAGILRRLKSLVWKTENQRKNKKSRKNQLPPQV